MRVDASGNLKEGNYVTSIYRQILFLALSLHVIYIVIFAAISYPILVSYNVVSVIFYSALIVSVRKGYYRTAVAFTHLEVSLFACVSVILTGWHYGGQLLLISLISLVYFCPFRRKYIPYLFSAGEIILFIGMKIYTNHNLPYYPPISVQGQTLLYTYNALCCFATILYVAFISKISANVSRNALELENKNLSIRANYDQLTGLLTRHALLDKMENSKPDASVVLALGDLDDFKVINDTYGHNCGDEILRVVSAFMNAICGSKAHICRWGGEEFVFLFFSGSKEEARRSIQELCDAVSSYEFGCEDYRIRVTMTFGICSTQERCSIADLVAHADEKMYQGKMEGKNRIIV